MSETPFYKTRMGHQFYERTMPALVKQLERVGGLLQMLSSQLSRREDGNAKTHVVDNADSHSKTD